MQAVILAGGLGTRLRPVTARIPKCMAQVGERPFLFYLLSLLKSRGIDDIVICIGYLGEQVEDYFNNGKEMGLKIRYSREKEMLLGTGGALKLAENRLDEKFFVVNGDTYLDIDYQNIFDVFRVSRKKALIVASRAGPGQRSDLMIGRNMLVTRYDKEAKQALDYVNAGVLALKRVVVRDIESGHPVSLEKEVFPTLIEKQEMMAFITQNNFYDIGTFNSLKLFETCIKESNDDHHAYSL